MNRISRVFSVAHCTAVFSTKTDDRRNIFPTRSGFVSRLDRNSPQFLVSSFFSCREQTTGAVSRNKLLSFVDIMRQIFLESIR